MRPLIDTGGSCLLKNKLGWANSSGIPLKILDILPFLIVVSANIYSDTADPAIRVAGSRPCPPGKIRGVFLDKPNKTLSYRIFRDGGS
jgi:hypothetical protein